MCFQFELFPLWRFWFGGKLTWFLLKHYLIFLPNIQQRFNFSLMFFFFLSWILISCLAESQPLLFDRTLYLRPAASVERSSCCLVRLLTHSAEDHAGTLLPSSAHLTSHAGTLDSELWGYKCSLQTRLPTWYFSFKAALSSCIHWVCSNVCFHRPGQEKYWWNLWLFDLKRLSY